MIGTSIMKELKTWIFNSHKELISAKLTILKNMWKRGGHSYIWQLLRSATKNEKMNQWFNVFHATGLFPCSLKIQKKPRLSDVFEGYRKIPLVWNRLMLFFLEYSYLLHCTKNEVFYHDLLSKCGLIGRRLEFGHLNCGFGHIYWRNP